MMLCRPGQQFLYLIDNPHKLMILPLRSGRPLAALRTKSLPIPPPRTIFLPDVKYADMELSQSPRPSMSSFTSMAPSIASSATTYTCSTSPSTPISPISIPSLPSSQSQSHSKTPPRPIFQGLPPEIYDCVIQQLRVVHEDPASQSCQTCYLRDLCSLALTSRGWDKAVVKRMWVKAVSHYGVQEYAANIDTGIIGYILQDMTRRNR